MSNENAPFAEGQKVVCLKTARSGVFVKDSIYTVNKPFKCTCGEWHLSITEGANKTGQYNCCNCGDVIPNALCPPTGGPARYFAPINPYSSDATKELVENIVIGDGVDQPVKVLVNN